MDRTAPRTHEKSHSLSRRSGMTWLRFARYSSSTISSMDSNNHLNCSHQSTMNGTHVPCNESNRPHYHSDCMTRDCYVHGMEELGHRQNESDTRMGSNKTRRIKYSRWTCHVACNYMGQHGEDCKRMGMKYGPDVYRWPEGKSTGTQRLTCPDSNNNTRLSLIPLAYKERSRI